MATLLPLVNPVPTLGSAARIAALTDAISTARLSTYLRRSHGNVRRALDLYEWNIRAGAAPNGGRSPRRCSLGHECANGPGI